MEAAKQILKSVFGYEQFRGEQEAIIQAIISGHNALVIMPTGGGKSLCYQIPAMVREGCGIVVSPLIALMQDQVDALQASGIRAGFLNSTQSYEDNQDIEDQLLAGKLDLLYIAPERLNQNRTFNLLKQTSIALFAIDEAHCVSQWGHDFRADYLQLGVLADSFTNVPRIALTATADARTREEISQRLHLQTAKHYLAGFDRPNIRYRITLKRQPKQQLLRFLRNEHADDSGIVYCLSRNKTEAIAEWLSQQGFTALPYHAGLSHQQRDLHQKRFLGEDKIIIVATIAFGMGIDKPDVRFVAHLDLPKSIEAYYQETGRAGRDGQAANAWMVYGLEDVIKLREMMQQSNTAQNTEYKLVEYQKLEAMLGLCEITTCRRQALLSYFGDNTVEKCGNCDMCLEPADTWDGTEAAQKAISCAYRTGQRFGVGHLIDVLMGMQTDKVKQFNHQNISVYGLGKNLTKMQWRSVYRQLIARNLLSVDFSQFNSIKLTEACRPLLKGQQQIALRQDLVEKASLRKNNGSNKSAKQQGELWEALRTCRATLAKEQGVPPYVIFHDSTLMEMAEMLPANAQQFLLLSGVGESKLEKYADAFLAVINTYKQTVVTSISPSAMETYDMLMQGLSIVDIAKKREVTESTIYTHASQLIRGKKINLDKVISENANDIKQIENALIDQGATQEGAKLKPVFEALGEKYSYGVIRCVYVNFLNIIDV